MPCYRILLIGAYGQFGGRIASTLAGDDGLALLLAGRDLLAAQRLVAALHAAGARATLEAHALDVDGALLERKLDALAPNLVIHTAGPFQSRDYRVARAALQCGAHYIDLADGRAFVSGIGVLDDLARQQARHAISGASSVPGLSGAVVAHCAPLFSRLDAVESAISPGNRTPRGVATTRAILGYVGRPYEALVDGHWRTVHGWQSLRRLEHPQAGTRWLARCEVPDLDVLPARWPQLRHCDFRAGLELRRMHFGLWLASWLVRAGVLPDLPRWTGPLLRLSERWLATGSDCGLMRVVLSGLGPDGRPLRVYWEIVATEGSGPQIPATAAIVLARKLARGALPGAGAGPCLDHFSLEEFMDALSGFPIRSTLRVT